MPSRIAWPERRSEERSRRTVRVAVLATDPLVQAGLLAELRSAHWVEVVEDPAGAEVVVAAAESGLRDLLTAATPLVLIAEAPRQAELWAAIECGLAVLVPRKEATTPRLLRAVADARAGRGDLPAEQLGELLRGVARLHEETLAPRDLKLSGLSLRETQVLRLLADGLDTADIAEKLAYSERTVKNVLQGLMSRLGLKNRAHAVAHGFRNGLI